MESNLPEHKAREFYRAFIPISLRWSDNDQYGHVNNVRFYSFFDTAVNQFLIERGVLSPQTAQSHQLEKAEQNLSNRPVGFVVHTHCDFYKPLSFPGDIDVGIRVGKMGRSSVTYQVAVFSKLTSAGSPN
jgi:acyl-CoA thioester hydrolase